MIVRVGEESGNRATSCGTITGGEICNGRLQEKLNTMR